MKFIPHIVALSVFSFFAPNFSVAQDSDANSKSYALPAFEIVGFEFLLNQYDRHFQSDRKDYETDFNSIGDNIRDGFGFDRDSFNINQIGHPYQGSIYYGLARSSGLNFWESFGYTTAGSLLWEIAGETTRPSTNDQITTSVGGSLLGEALFRTAETFWPVTRKEKKDIARTVGAAIVSPATDVNRLALDKPITPDRVDHPILFRKLELGVLHNDSIENPEGSKVGDRTRPAAGFNIQYGIPGKSGYEYNQPFDYFDMDAEFSSSGSDPVDHLFVNGLLYGQKYNSADSLRGVDGLYGNYNYLAPEIFRVSSSGLSLGTILQWYINNDITLQSSTLAGVGFGAGGTIRQTDGTNDYHYGAVPQGTITERLIFDDRVSIDVSGQDFLVTGATSNPGESGTENITRLQVGLSVRAWRSHGFSLTYGESRRNASLDKSADERQHVETVSVFYNYLWGSSLSGTAREY